MSFHEKSAWACLVTTVGIFIPYFALVLLHPMAYVGLIIVATIVQVVLLVGFHIVNALATKSIRETGDTPPLDELDRLIELKASKFSGIVLATAVMTWCCVAMFAVPASGVVQVMQAKAQEIDVTAANFAMPVMQAMVGVHLLFAGFVIAHASYYAGIVFGYRRISQGWGPVHA